MVWAILGWYAAMSVVSFAAMGFDKSRARSGGRRVSEKRLHLLEAVGGWPGGLVGAQVFRHKSSKTGYLVVLWAIVAAHGACWSLWWFW